MAESSSTDAPAASTLEELGIKAEPAGHFKRFHHCQFWVGNAIQAATYYATRFGFERVAYRGLETGNRDVVTHVLRNGNVVFTFSSPLNPGNKEFAAWFERSGDGVRDVCFEVDNARAIYEKAVAAGAESIREPWEETDENGTAVLATIRTYGDTLHTFVQLDGYHGPFLPNFRAVEEKDPVAEAFPNTDLLFIDHIVGNQDWGEMLDVERWYTEKLGFHRFWCVDDKQMHTEFSALRSVVMTDEEENVKMPINEPAKGKRKSQIEEFVEYYGGPGVQHIALRTNDILHSVAALRSRGLKFLNVPKAYYDDLRERLSRSAVQVKEDIDKLEELSILVDFDEKGYLLQIFTKPVEDRPTLFIEIIQRANHEGFGVGNFKALFESIERDQAERGNL